MEAKVGSEIEPTVYSQYNKPTAVCLLLSSSDYYMLASMFNFRL